MAEIFERLRVLLQDILHRVTALQLHNAMKGTAYAVEFCDAIGRRDILAFLENSCRLGYLLSN